MVLRNVLIGLGALALLVGLSLVAVWLIHAPTQTASDQARTLPRILIAARPIAMGALLRPGDTAWKEVADGVAPGNILRDAGNETAFMGGVTRRSFDAGEPLAESAIVKHGDRSFLAAVLAPGDRAVTIGVDGPEIVAGLVLPGDRVDLILTQNFGTDPADPGHRLVGETVLKNIRVIAVDQWLNTVVKPGAKDPRAASGSSIPSMVTLEVSNGDAERALVAVQLGKVQLAVRALAGAGSALSGDALRGDKQMPRPTWAADVSPALLMLERPKPSASLAQPGATMAPSGAVQERQFVIEVMHGAKIEVR